MKHKHFNIKFLWQNVLTSSLSAGTTMLRAIQVADKAVEEFEKRFPPPVIETKIP